MKRIVLGFVFLLVLVGCGNTYSKPDQLAPPPAPKTSASVIYETQTNDQSQTLKEVKLPDGTVCVIVSYDTGLGTDCNWGK